MTPLGATLRPLPGAADPDFVRDFDSALKSAGLGELSGELSAVLGSVADASPFLRGLMLANPAMVVEVVGAPLAASVATASKFEGDLGSALRRGRQRVALAVALADLCADASVETVTEALSAFADDAVRAALKAVLGEAAANGRALSDDPAQCGVIVLAMGKLGGHELNYSSDIDLVFLFDEERSRAVGLSSKRVVALTQRFTKLLTERTTDGYVFRVDLRLRPDPGSTPVAVSTSTALAYYQSRARAWERQAMIKARQVAGDGIAGAAYLRALEPSIWHTGYDFGAIDDAIAMREQIAAIKGAGDITVPGHNIKVGRGGIREIEFLVQSLQKTAGGRDQKLRGNATLPMLEALARAGWMRQDDCTLLSRAYRYLRRVEHRLQMVADEQVHTLPDASRLDRITRMMDEPAFEETLRSILIAVHGRFVDLVDGGVAMNPAIAGLNVEAQAADSSIEPEFREKADGWQEGGYASLRSERARGLLRRLEGPLAQAIKASADPSAALAGIDALLARLPAGVDFLSRLDRQRDLLPVLVLIVSAAPRLAEQLVRRPRLLDVLVDPQFYGRQDNLEAMEAALDEALANVGDYEAKLDALRVFTREHMMLIEVRILAGSILGVTAGQVISALAQMVTSRALDVAMGGFAERHGQFAGGGVAVLGLGSFGSREMTPSSDLDMVFIYDAPDEAAQSDGPRPLTPGHYFSRAAQRFIAALSAPTARGQAFEVDLRLRPSGRAGPLATHIRSFERYHEESAWVWEHMALTRARLVAGDEQVGARAMKAIGAALTRPRDPETLAQDVLAMRRKLNGLSRDDAKHAPGGLVDIEFIVQYLRLRTGLATNTTQTRKLLRELAQAGAIDGGSLELLSETHRLFRRLMLLFSIAGVPAQPDAAPLALQPLLVRAAEAPDIAFLAADLSERREKVRALFETVIGSV
ncbi:MAG: bifunctional [glutamine synthetase] adenylyltransferase/[glutamine synthetase]-adenylyl-L-tyrosine phosphorylase [Pseudomonadota bacterium]